MALARRFSVLAASLLLLVAGGVFLGRQAQAAPLGSCGSAYSVRTIRGLSTVDGRLGGLVTVYSASGNRWCAIARPSAVNMGKPSRMAVNLGMRKDGYPYTSGDWGAYKYYAGPVYLNVTGASERTVGAEMQIGNTTYYAFSTL